MSTNNRRDFFKKTGLLTAGLISIPALAQSNSLAKPGKKKIIYRTLGNTGIKVPIVSMGVMNANNPALLKEAYNQGIRHFDTAWFYQRGKNEEMVGDVLREVKADRKKVTISTKIYLGDYGPNYPKGKKAKESFLKRFDESLTRLKMDYVDILYYHAVSEIEQANDPYIIEAFQELKAQNKIKHTGFSTHNYWPDLLTDAANKGFYEVVLLSINYSMANDPKTFEAMQYAAKKGIGLVAMKTQCQQDWYKSMLPSDIQKFYEGQIMHTALLKWVLKHEYITTAVPGFTTFSQLTDDFTVASDLEYTGEEKQFLTDHHVVAGLQQVCHLCGKCTGSCPNGVDIPSLMRVHMYSESYGNTSMATNTLNNIPKGKNFEQCAKCDVCSARCVRNVPVAERIADLKNTFA